MALKRFWYINNSLITTLWFSGSTHYVHIPLGEPDVRVMERFNRRSKKKKNWNTVEYLIIVKNIFETKK